MFGRPWLPTLAFVTLVVASSAAADGMPTPSGEDSGHKAAGSPPPMEHPALVVAGFTDFNFQATDKKVPGSTSGFRSGQFVLHMTSTLGPRFSFFGEISFTAHDNGYSTEIERSILKYTANDYLGLSFGRYHTPINWWNTAYHHGLWLQTTVDRPEMVRVGGTFIPVHFVGAVAQGVAPVAGSDLDYQAGVGNGRADTLSRAGDAGDVNNDRAWFGTLALRPNALLPLEVGGGFYQDLTHPAVGESFREDIAAAHVVWTKETPEVLSEFAFVRHTGSETRITFDDWADYVQIAYRLPWANAHFKPYARAERLKIEDNDPVFAAVADLTEFTGGLRWDVADFVALKGEYRRTNFKKTPDVNAGYLQICCTF